jgi:hypothetical protein
VDGIRGGYPDEQEGRWLPGDRGYGERYEEERYRVPDPRYPDPDRGGAVGRRSGVELPPLQYPPEPTPYVPEPYASEVPPSRESAFSAQSLGTVPQEHPAPPPPPAPPPTMADPESTGGFHTEAIDRAALRRPPGVSAPRPTVYRARRAGIMGALAAVAVVAELFLVRVLLAGEFGHVVAPGAVLGGLFAMTGIPLVAMGLYGLMTGAAAAGPTPAPAWLRTPLAYLPIGLVLLVAAGLAAA